MATPETPKSADTDAQSRNAETEVASTPSSANDTAVPHQQASNSGPDGRAARSKSASTSKSAKGDGAPKKTISQLGDFKLVRKLGQGGMGTVYLAKQVSLDRNVAVKTLSKEFAKKEDFVKRFLREARSMAKLHHPNIVQVFAADSKAGFHFVAIEFIDGKSMQDWMDEQKQLSVGDALHVILVCADALQHAHELSMIHRDIKPDNILVTRKGVVKVADFGLAKAMDEEVSVTQSGTGLGTPLYMAPEQARNAKHVDQRSDIYALGCTLYYFLTGQLPFKGDNTLELIMAKEEGKFKPARRINRDVPEQLDLMIDKMMAKKPEHRYESCAEIIRDLRKLQRENDVLSFVEGEGGASLGRLATPSTPAVSAPRTPAASRAGNSSGAAAPAGSEPTQKVWYVHFKDPKGKYHLQRMTTEKITAAIRAGKLGLDAKAKTSEDGQLLPLAQYAEFTHLVESRAVAVRTAAKSDGMKNLYAEYEAAERRRKRWGWLKNLVGKAQGGLGLVIWLAVVGAIGYGLYWGAPLAWNYAAEYFNLK